jgi:hypothetical protein
MKNIILSFCLVFSSFGVFAKDDFEIIDVKNDFEQLNKVEKYIHQHPESSLADLKSNSPEVLEGLILEENTNSINSNSMKDMPLVGGFWWGCCLGVVGLALVYFITDNNKSQVRPALWGCLIFTILGGSIYGVWNPFGW